ncbi:MAG TPA: hypothetical protein VFX98_13815 [Longimicrobiaceae bacterium]|nr:hypothetical protein [Longimicrobiaceae bacterium]
MRKLKLEVEELRVESFQTAGHSEDRGTVQGNLMNRDVHDTFFDDYCRNYETGLCPGTWDCYYGTGNITCISATDCVQQTPCNGCQ